MFLKYHMHEIQKPTVVFFFTLPVADASLPLTCSSHRLVH